MSEMRWAVASVLLLGVAGAAWPQAATGSVTGTVMAQDTQRPVRFAQVTLQAVAETSSGQQTQGLGIVGARNGPGGQGSVQVRTEADGTFFATGMTPGDYYVTAGEAGYIPERAVLLAAVAAGSDPATLLARIPVVKVVANSVSSVTVTIEHGGVISGHVQWEDGSPASGVNMSATLANMPDQLPVSLQGIQGPGANPNATTDDKGSFRVAGLEPGEYLLRAVIQPPMQFGGVARVLRFYSPIRLYSPGVFRASEAKTVSVRGGEERSDVTMTLDLTKLRTVSGTVGAVGAGMKVASGRVSLADGSDRELNMMGSIAADGRFEIKYVPPGTYTLQISGASSQETAGGDRRGRGRESSEPVTLYQGSSQSVTVGDSDVSGIAVVLTPLAKP